MIHKIWKFFNSGTQQTDAQIEELSNSCYLYTREKSANQSPSKHYILEEGKGKLEM